ncbi:MAG: HemK2/MTQ2 family protein methyltransferase [Candidatus Woesearchaeota archaeon]
MDIYESDEDSYLLSKYVEKLIKPNYKVLDIGCGSGIQCETALKKTKSVLGVDINSNAIEYCKKSEYCNSAKFKQSDLFSNIKKQKYDVIIFNPPYLPDAKDPKNMKLYTTGGKKGYEIIERFLSEVNYYLTENGFILLLFSSLTKKDVVDQLISNYLLDFKLLDKKSIMMEVLYCYKITKSSLLKKLNRKNIHNSYYLSKGKRGIVYKAKFKNKNIVIKIKNSKSQALNTIINEGNWLKKLNKYNIGPKLYFYDEDMIVMEYIDGILIGDYIKSFNEKKIKKIILLLLDQMYIMDKLKIEKKEMVRPLKHIIIRKDKPVLIDFERVKLVELPGNVTQFLEFLSRLNIIDRKKSIKLSMNYKKEYDIKKIKKFLYSL